MFRLLRNITILLLPFLLMIAVNEAMSNQANTRKGKTVINSSLKKKDRCTWACHDFTLIHCAVHHVKWFKSYAQSGQSFYYTLLRKLRETNRYALANIFLFVIAGPLAIWYLLIRSLNIQDEINRLRQIKKNA